MSESLRPGQQFGGQVQLARVDPPWRAESGHRAIAQPKFSSAPRYLRILRIATVGVALDPRFRSRPLATRANYGLEVDRAQPRGAGPEGTNSIWVRPGQPRLSRWAFLISTYALRAHRPDARGTRLNARRGVETPANGPAHQPLLLGGVTHTPEGHDSTPQNLDVDCLEINPVGLQTADFQGSRLNRLQRDRLPASLSEQPAGNGVVLLH